MQLNLLLNSNELLLVLNSNGNMISMFRQTLKKLFLKKQCYRAVQWPKMKLKHSI